LVLSSELKSFLEYHGYASEKVAVVPNGVDASFFSPLVSGKKGLSEKTILYIGSMTRDDGLDILIEAFALLEPRSQLKLVLIGKGPERFKLMQLVKKFGLERNVVFLSFVSHEHMPNFIRDAYITVGPLRQSPINHYTIPTKLLEYFACGKATVSVKVSRDVLIDGFNGFIIEKVSPESVAEKLRILIEDEQLAETLGKNGRQLVLERFDWEKIIDAFEKELEDVKP
jgi:glycosyltransferase involved in cell wall biosynthesis